MTISLQTIAEECGVSAMTVSRALDPAKQHKLSPKTLTKVLAAVERCGYITNTSARRLKLGRLDTITLIIGPRSFHPQGPTGFDAFTDTRRWGMLQQVLQEARKHRFEVKVEASMVFGDCQEVIQSLQGTLTDGVIFDNASEMEPVIRYVTGENLPCIVMRHDVPEASLPCPKQSLDRRPGLEAAFRYILDHGHRRIGFLGINNMQSSRNIHQTFREFFQPLGVFQPELCHYCHDTLEVRTWLDGWKKGPSCSAIFCGNDCLADFLVKELRYRGMRVPQEIAVIGYDGHPAFPELSTVRVPSEEMAARSVRSLLQLIENPQAVSDSCFETVFIPKNTT